MTACWLFIAAVTALSAISVRTAAGLAPDTRSPLPVDLRAVLSASTDGGDRHRAPRRIVVIQVAMAVVLMTAAGLLVRSFLHLRATDPRLRSARCARGARSSWTTRPTTAARRRARTTATLFEHLSALPGVVAVGGATTVPTSPLGPDFERPVWPEGAPDSAQRDAGVGPHGDPRIRPARWAFAIVDGRAIDDRDSPRRRGC